MIVSDIETVTVLVILLFGIPIFWNARKNGLLKSFSFIELIKTINKSLKIQAIIGLILIPLTWTWNSADFIFDSVLTGTTYTYLIIGFFMYLPALAFLNFIKLLIEGKSEKQKNKINIAHPKKDELDENFIKAIIEKLKDRLERNLTSEEYNVFTKQRSEIAYEMILDYLSDKELSKLEIESYVQKVIEENKKTTHNTV
tara:strand:- start:916 stop:1512 length:597 start_codon:yes stop_codon:yes gene_type:complete